MKKFKTIHIISPLLSARIITVLVLLILAGVSLNAIVGENGIITNAMDAKDKNTEASEKELLQIQIVSNQELNEKGEIKNPIGELLKDKKVGESWKVLLTDEGVYGTGWSYVPKGTELKNYGKLEKNWLMNYETGEVKKIGEIRRLKDIENLEEVEKIGSNIILSSTDNLSVEEGIILNIDSSVIDGDVGNSKNELENKLGEGVELIGFDYDDNSGLTTTSFNFDGINDYIKIPYDNKLAYHSDGTPYIDETNKQLTEKEVLAKNGFTFEFYGKINEGTFYTNVGEKVEPNYYVGLFSYCKDNSGMAALRFGINDFGRAIYWNAGSPLTFSDLSMASWPWNQSYVFDESFDIFGQDDHFIQIVLNINDEFGREGIEDRYYRHEIYIDGQKVFSGGYNVKSWSTFLNDSLDILDTFNIGRCQMTNIGWWSYAKMRAYSIRLYSRGLTEDEIMENYKSSIVYHNFIEKLNK